MENSLGLLTAFTTIRCTSRTLAGEIPITDPSSPMPRKMLPPCRFANEQTVSYRSCCGSAPHLLNSDVSPSPAARYTFSSALSMRCLQKTTVSFTCRDIVALDKYGITLMKIFRTRTIASYSADINMLRTAPPHPGGRSPTLFLKTELFSFLMNRFFRIRPVQRHRAHFLFLKNENFSVLRNRTNVAILSAHAKVLPGAGRGGLRCHVHLCERTRATGRGFVRPRAGTLARRRRS